MKVAGFAGFSGAGKTTLIERLIPALKARGLRVSVVKHAHHRFDIDHPGKDSFRHRQAGAFEVVVDGYAMPRPSSRGAYAWGPARDGATCRSPALQYGGSSWHSRERHGALLAREEGLHDRAGPVGSRVERVRSASQKCHDQGHSRIEERIQEAMETYRRGDAEGDAALVRRNGRDLGAWINALRSLGAGSNADLRTAPLPRERLFRIVESPTAAAGERAAAAVALGTELDEEGRARLRSAAEATAAPKLRIAIEQAAASADEEALREALSALESEPEEKQAAR